MAECSCDASSCDILCSVESKDKPVFVWDADLRVDGRPLQGSPRYLAGTYR